MAKKKSQIEKSKVGDEVSLGKVRETSDSFELTVERVVEIESLYQARLSRNNALLDEVVFILRERLAASEIKIHGIEHRVKSITSAIEKCKRKNVVDLGALSDIVGARVICLFRSDIERIRNLIEGNFDVLDIDDKLSIENNPLGYLSVHFTCKLPTRYQGPRYENTSELKFEIQFGRCVCMRGEQYLIT